jgi:FkbM family methyltransferase
VTATTATIPTPPQRLIAAAGRALALPAVFPLALDPAVSRTRGPRRVLVKRYGSVLELALDDYVQRRIFCWSHQRGEVALVRDWCRPGDAVIDVGANVGLFTLVAARSVGPQGRVLSIEAMPGTFDVLRRNVERNGYRHVAVRQLAVAAEPSELTLGNVDPGDGTGGVTVGGAMGHATVPGRPLDHVVADWAGDRDTPIRLLKIDVEGFEKSALDGARGLLGGRLRPELILFEVSETALARFNTSGADLEGTLRAAGYRLWTRSLLGLKPFTAVSAERRSRTGGARSAGRLGGVVSAVRDAELLAEVIAVAPGVALEVGLRRRLGSSPAPSW